MKPTKYFTTLLCLVAGAGTPLFAQTVTSPLPPVPRTPSPTSTPSSSTSGATAPPAGTATGGIPAAPSRPQPLQKPFARFGGFSFSGYLRSRVESYDFFEATNGDNRYDLTGHQLRISGVRSTPRLDVQIDLQQQLLTNLPANAVYRPNATTNVPLGPGGNYALANGSQDGALNFKQGFLRFKNSLGKGSAIRLGRFEFGEGAETTSTNPTINFLKSQRIAQRLVGTFAFTHTGRAFDGGQISLPFGKTNFTLVGARPTEGVFQLEANDNVDAVNFLYGALSKTTKRSDARLFALGYEDGRKANKSVKLDNRPLATRQADNNDIRVYTLGGNYTRTFGVLDVLAWGAVQTGKWGTLDHRGNAYTLEAGYQPKMKFRPWIRTGYYRSSGDGNANDGTHKTFLTPLATPRIHSRYPFYNQMNLEDLFVQLIVRPNSKLNLRSEAHLTRLASAGDLYYFGGGPFQDNGFGIGGRPSGNNKGLANIFDFSADYTISPLSSIGVYIARAFGKGAIESNYTLNKNSTFGFVEYTTRF